MNSCQLKLTSFSVYNWLDMSKLRLKIRAFGMLDSIIYLLRQYRFNADERTQQEYVVSTVILIVI